MADFESSWSAADPAVLRCLEQAHASLLAGGLPCGAVVVDEDGGGGRKYKKLTSSPP
ncbi:MAG TPA: hypothetical protein VHJ18_13620 [Streptosporangiaceae bacterium]|jgi:hypothetical protein|nr:hypothetical protein [Streptosporangiaceae bacterium]